MEHIVTSRAEVFNEVNFRPTVPNTVTKIDINCFKL